MIENHVTSLELSKQLKELGVKQESIFFWVKYSGVHPSGNSYNCEHQIWGISEVEQALEDIEKEESEFEAFEHTSAFLSSELGELLKNNGVTCNWQLDTDGTWKWTAYQPSRLNSSFNDEAECNARAKMLIYLTQQRLAKGGRA